MAVLFMEKFSSFVASSNWLIFWSRRVDPSVASTTSIENIDAIFKTLNKKIEKKDFDFIGNNELIKKVKPEPDIYIKALNDLGVNRDECIAIEDSLDSALSALKAKVECIAFPGLFHVDDDFSYCKKCLNKLDISIFENW